MESTHPLSAALAPGTVAVIGATERAGALGRHVFSNILQGGYRGALWPVNPKHDTVLGQRCYASMEALPEVPDLIVLVTPARTVPDLIDAAGRLGVRQVLSHHKVIGRANFGRSRDTLALFDAARRTPATRDVCLDCYPYTASSTVLRQDTARLAQRVLIAWSTARPAAAGRYLDELAAEAGLEMEAMIDALQPAGAIYFAMDEADVERILAYPETMIGSDGLPHDAFPHPRLWGAFPRVLGHYARGRGLFSLEAAVHKMTGLPADRFRLTGRGRIEPGCSADLVVFDPDRIADAATFAQPKTAAIGIVSVYVNGTRAWHDGRETGARTGQVLRRGI